MPEEPATPHTFVFPHPSEPAAPTPYTFTRTDVPGPLSERPATPEEPLRPGEVRIVVHHDNDGLVTTYEIDGDVRELERMTENAIDILCDLLARGEADMSLADYRVAAAHSLQLAALMEHPFISENKSVQSRAYRILDDMRARLMSARGNAMANGHLTLAEIDRCLVKGYAYFSFDWSGLFGRILGR